MESWFTTLEAWMTQIPEPLGTLVNYILVFLLLAFLFVLPLVTFTVLIERKVIGFMQHRFGPNRVGPRGWLQTIADAVKLIQKEDITLKDADPIPFWLAPIVVFVPTFISYAVIAFGGQWTEQAHFIAGNAYRDFRVWAPVDLNVAVLWILAMSSVGGIGVFMAGWASNNKYSIFGAMRGVAQIISYEVPMILTLLAVVLMTGSMSLKDIALRQGPQWQPYFREYGLQVAYTDGTTVNQAEVDQKLAAAAPVYAQKVLDTEGLPTDTLPEFTDTNMPMSRVVERPGFTIVLLGANSDTVGTMTSSEGVDDPDNPALISQLATEVLPPGWDANRTEFHYGSPVPIRWAPVTGGIPYLIPMFLGFIIFFITATAETNRAPFDLPEAESELVSGFHTEYSGMKFALFFLGEYAAMILMASLATICFLGAWWVPWFMTPLAEQFPVIYFFSYFLKMYFLIYVMIWFRATFPRLRPDQLMDFTWKGLFPLALVNLLVVAYFQFSDWSWLTLKQTNYQLWYNNAIAGLDWPIWRLLVAMLLLPLLPDFFDREYPRVKKYLTPALWIFSLAFVFDQIILNQVWRGNVIPHYFLMDACWIASIYLFGMSFITLAEHAPAQHKLFKISLFALMLIVPIASAIGYTERAAVEVASLLAIVQALLWWVVTVPTILGLFQLATMRQPEERVAIISNSAVGFKPVSLNTGDVKSDITTATDLGDFFTRARPPALATAAGPEDIPDWRTAQFPDEEPEQPKAIPGQQEWGPVKPLKGLNNR